MFALAERLGVPIEHIEAMPVKTFNEWLGYFVVKREREKRGDSG